jgi:hypothetical protein
VTKDDAISLALRAIECAIEFIHQDNDQAARIELRTAIAFLERGEKR